METSIQSDQELDFLHLILLCFIDMHTRVLLHGYVIYVCYCWCAQMRGQLGDTGFLRLFDCVIQGLSSDSQVFPAIVFTS